MRLSLVTGGNGFIGRHLVDLLCSRGERVRVFDLRAPEGPPRAAAGSVEFRHGDITDATAIEEFLADRVTRRAPRAPLTGVRLARRPMRFDNSRALAELGLQLRPLRRSLGDAIAWFAQQGLLRQDQPGRARAEAEAGE